MNIKETLRVIDPDLLEEINSQTDFFLSIGLDPDFPLAHLWAIKDRQNLLWSGGVPDTVKSRLGDILEEFHKKNNCPIFEAKLSEDKEYLKEKIQEIIFKDHGIQKKDVTLAHLYYFWSTKEGQLLTLLKEKNISNEDIELFFI